MARARNRKGFGWKRWSTQWLYQSLRLYNGYKVAVAYAESRSSTIGPITLEVKQTGERSAGDREALASTWRGLETWHGRR